mgnify:CR=1 FL=1
MSNIKEQEKAIGNRAKNMAQNYLHAVLQQKLTMRGKGGQKMKPLIQSSKVQVKMGDYRLLGLNVTSSKVGFIQHYGFMGVRAAGVVRRSGSEAFMRSSHQVSMPGKFMFDDIW